MTQHSPALSRSIRRHLKAGIAVVILLAGGVGGWAATTNIAGAVIASGALVVDSNVKKVQHATGGIVGELRVREGQKVKVGEIVVRLDETVTRASLAIVTKGLSELMARKARLEAERDGADAVVFPPELARLADEATVKALMAGERRLFEIRNAARVGQKAQLRQRVGQLLEEIGGLKAQETAKGRELVLIERELDGARSLFEKNLLPITKLTTLEREATRLEGERAQVVAATAQARGRIAEIELQVIQVDRDLSSEVGKELREIDGKIGEFIERKVTAEDQLKRIDIRAPQDGAVHQLAVHTVGGVITAGEPIMLIVPEADRLTVEARIGPQEIDQVRLGQKAILRFSAFNQATTPELWGELSRISADAVNDPRTGSTYYVIRIALREDELARLGELRLVPGMPVEAFIQTGERKVISYLIKPMRDQLKRAFREG